MKLRIIKISMPVIALLLCLPCRMPAQTTDFIDALMCYREGNVLRASSLFRKEIALNPDNDAAHFYFAGLLAEGKNATDLELAEKHYLKAVELDPGNYWYKYTLAAFYENTGRPELATPLLEDLIRRHPGKRSLYFDTASAYMRQNDIDKALECLDKIEANMGKSDMVAITRADLMTRQDKGNDDRAFEYLEEYYKNCPTPRLATMLGDHYQRIYRDSTAIGYYNQALEMDGSSPAAYYGRAHSWQGLRQYDRYFEDMAVFMKNEDIPATAKAEYINHLLENPKFVMAFKANTDDMVDRARTVHIADSTLNNAAGLYYYRTDRKIKAAEIFMQNMNFHPESFTVGFQYLLMLYYSDAWDRTAEVATILLQKFPGQRDPLIIRASAFRQLKQYPSAIEDYKAYNATAPKDSATIMNSLPALGDTYYEAGDYRNAFDCYKKTLRVSPGNTLVLNNYAYFLCLQGKNLKKAREMSRKCIEAEPDNPTYLDTYAWILHNLGQDVEAKAIFKHAMLYGGKENAALLDHYAEVLWALKEYDLAYIYWNQAKSLDRDNELGIEARVRERKAAQNTR